MKTLMLMRHAKSSWDDAMLADFNRPLNDRGRRAAPFMGEKLRIERLVPDIIVASPATRARQTAELVAEAGQFTNILFDEQIYEASTMDLLRVAGAINDVVQTAMVVGHNPGMEGFIRYLTGKIEPMPTGAVAVISLNIDSWTATAAGCGQVDIVLRPKDIMHRSKPA